MCCGLEFASNVIANRSTFCLSTRPGQHTTGVRGTETELMVDPDYPVPNSRRWNISQRRGLDSWSCRHVSLVHFRRDLVGSCMLVLETGAAVHVFGARSAPKQICARVRERQNGKRIKVNA